ncbi:MAG: hypothetical protein WC222_08990 [Parachlamydiales bacterium]|jgi:hypothetical protein
MSIYRFETTNGPFEVNYFVIEGKIARLENHQIALLADCTVEEVKRQWGLVKKIYIDIPQQDNIWVLTEQRKLCKIYLANIHHKHYSDRYKPMEEAFPYKSLNSILGMCSLLLIKQKELLKVVTSLEAPLPAFKIPVLPEKSNKISEISSAITKPKRKENWSEIDLLKLYSIMIDETLSLEKRSFKAASFLDNRTPTGCRKAWFNHRDHLIRKYGKDADLEA